MSTCRSKRFTTKTSPATRITAAAASGALRAFDLFGKGRHPAGLNMGDCFAYACAEELRAPLLFKGEDFPLTGVGELGA